MHIKFNDLFSQMQQQLEQPQAVLNDQLLIELVERIRPIDAYQTDEIHQKFQALIQALLITPDAASTLQSLYCGLFPNINKPVFMPIQVSCL